MHKKMIMCRNIHVCLLLASATADIVQPREESTAMLVSSQNDDSKLNINPDKVLSRRGASTFGSAQYWEDRYTRDTEAYDWYDVQWEDGGLRDTLKHVLQPSHSILMVGCGTSRLSEGLYDDGYTDITNIDISMVVIDKMRGKYADDRPLMKWRTMDCRQMDFPSWSFNLVLDKGTMDALLVSDRSTEDVHEALTDIARVLDAKHGVFVLISFEAPGKRLKHLEHAKFGWNVVVKTVPHRVREDSYVYICTKGTPFVKWDGGSTNRAGGVEPPVARASDNQEL